MKQILLAFTCLLLSKSFAQKSDSCNFVKYKKIIAWSLSGSTTIGVHAALYKSWYSQYPVSKFHWKNDNHEWLQMDKFGHAWASSFITANTAEGFMLAGYNKRKSAIIGAGIAMAFQYTIEFFDGRSAGWGASSGDLVANTAGILYAGVQRYFWGKSRIPFRFTYRPTQYASIRPALLGSNAIESILKDYNGQTYWVDFNPNRMKIKSSWWPKCLGLSLGYGAHGMVGGDDNIWQDKNNVTVDRSDIQRYRQFFISPSLTFGHIHSKYALVRVLAYITDHVRVPMPAIELRNSQKVALHLLYW